MTKITHEFCFTCKDTTDHYVHKDTRYREGKYHTCRACVKRRNQKRPKKGCAKGERLCKHHGAVQWRKYGKQIRCPLCVKANNDKQTARRIAIYGSS